METTSIRLTIRNLPDHFDRTRIATVLDEIELALLEEREIHCSTSADSFTITIVVPTLRLVDVATCLKGIGLI
jgi:hypothetical protein